MYDSSVSVGGSLLNKVTLNNVIAMTFSLIENSKSDPILIICTKNQDKSLLWHEELNCLFIKCRWPTVTVLTKFIVLVYGPQMTSTHNEFSFILSHSQKYFNQWRYLYHKKLKNIVATTKNSNTISDQEINQVISIDYIRYNLFQDKFKALDFEKFVESKSLEKIQEYVKASFKLLCNNSSTKELAKLDYKTYNIAVPSKNGRNIADSIIISDEKVRESEENDEGKDDINDESDESEYDDQENEDQDC
nr:11724_t:CDS:2 [Entrophospora candida]